MTVTFSSVNRPDPPPHGWRGAKPGSLLEAILSTARTHQAIRVELNGRRVTTLRTQYYKSLLRRGLRLATQTNPNEPACLYMWVEPIEGMITKVE